MIFQHEYFYSNTERLKDTLMRLAEIAKQANVSPATVSRVINSPALVSPERRRVVEEVLRLCNYHPSPKERRRGPKGRQSDVRRIGVWFVGAKQSPALNWFQDQIGQMQPANSRHRIDLRILFSDTAAEIPGLLQKRELDGVIIQGMEPAAECLRRLADFPVVWFMTRRTAEYPGDYVEPNNRENGCMAADYLHSRGHKRVTVMATDPDYSAIGQRIGAFVQRSTELGMSTTVLHRPPGRDVSFLNPTPQPEELDALFTRFREIQPRPTGVFLPFDQFCGQFFRSMRSRGIEPGRDFEVILGNFTEIIYQNLDPLPAAIDINLPTLVSTVLDHLIWRIDNPDARGRVGIQISPSLVLPDAPGPD